MHFDLSADQYALQHASDRMLAAHCSIPQLDRFVAGDPSPQKALAAAFREFGGPGLVVPEEFGGSGLSLFDSMVVAFALGRATAPLSFIDPCIRAPLTVGMAGNEPQRKRWLGAIAKGDERIAVVDSPCSDLRIEHERLYGRAVFVMGHSDATAFLLTIGSSVAIARAGQTGISLRDLQVVDKTRSFGEVIFEGAEFEALKGDGPRAAGRARDAGRILLAADTLGACEALLERAVEQAKARVQFGQPIGAFQAIKHMCAEMAAELELARSLLWYAAYTFDHDPEQASALAARTKAHVDDTGRFIARTATEVHGAMGFAELSGVHFWFKRITTNRPLLGSPEQLRREAGGRIT